jgi:hypothetical protein
MVVYEFLSQLTEPLARYTAAIMTGAMGGAELGVQVMSLTEALSITTGVVFGPHVRH